MSNLDIDRVGHSFIIITAPIYLSNTNKYPILFLLLSFNIIKKKNRYFTLIREIVGHSIDMSSYFSSFGTKIPRMGKGYDDVFTVTKTKHAVKQPVSWSNYKVPCNLSKQHIGFVSKFPVMEEEQQKRLDVLAELSEDYSEELEVAVRAVQMASSLCQRVQDTIISNQNQVQSKDDDSPVTVAGECCLFN